MSSYSVAEAKNHLPKLLDRMLEGEEVVITRRGKAIARLVSEDKALKQPPVDIEWLRRIRLKADGGPDSVELVREMRDDRL